MTRDDDESGRERTRATAPHSSLCDFSCSHVSAYTYVVTKLVTQHRPPVENCRSLRCVDVWSMFSLTSNVPPETTRERERLSFVGDLQMSRTDRSFQLAETYVQHVSSHHFFTNFTHDIRSSRYWPETWQWDNTKFRVSPLCCHVKIVTKIKEKKEFGSPHSYTLFYKDFDDSEQRLGVTKAENSSRLRRCLLSRGLFIRFLIMRLVKVLQDESLHSVSFRDAYSYYFGYRRVLCAAGYFLDSYW